MKVINEIIKKCNECPYFSAGNIYVGCIKSYHGRELTEDEFDAISDDKLLFPDWCPLEDLKEEE